MNQHVSEAFPLQELEALEDIELVSKTVVEGFLSGLHRSPFLGYSSEFSSYRHYMQGDNLRHIDWKLWGRTDKYYVKQFEDDTNLECRIFLDASGSMRFGKADKFRFARILTGALCCLMSRQNDAPGISIFGEDPIRSLPCRNGMHHLESLLLLLSGTNPSGRTAFSKELFAVGETFLRRGLAVIISDCFDTEAAVFKFIKQLRMQGHEVVLFHVLAREELEFPFTGEYSMQDAETSLEHRLNATQFRQTYLKRFHAFLDKLKSECQKLEADYRQILSDMPFDKALIEYLEYRAHLRR